MEDAHCWCLNYRLQSIFSAIQLWCAFARICQQDFSFHQLHNTSNPWMTFSLFLVILSEKLDNFSVNRNSQRSVLWNAENCFFLRVNFPLPVSSGSVLNLTNTYRLQLMKVTQKSMTLTAPASNAFACLHSSRNCPHLLGALNSDQPNPKFRA